MRPKDSIMVNGTMLGEYLRDNESIEEEINSLPLFDYVVVNRQGELDSAVSEITDIVTAERRRASPRLIELK